MSAAAGGKRGLFSGIETREDALKVAKDSSTAFFVVAGLQALIAFVLGFSVLIDAGAYLVGGFFVRRYHSRAAAIVLLLLAGVSAAVTAANRMGADLGGGKNVLLALIVLGAAVRAVEATFKLHGRFADEGEAEEPRPADASVRARPAFGFRGRLDDIESGKRAAGSASSVRPAGAPLGVSTHILPRS